MVHHRLVLGLPESLAPLPRSPTPPCTPCVEGRQRAAPHPSSFPPTTAPLQTLHLDVWGPSLVLGPRQERYFLILVDEYSRYSTVFPLRRKVDVPTVLKPWLLARGGVQSLFRYAAHQPNLWPSDAWPRVTPIFLWTGFPGVAANYRRPVRIVSRGARGVVAEGEGTRAAGAHRPSSGGARGVRVETTPEEDTAVSTQRPRPASPPGFLSIPQFPPCSPPWPVAAEPGGVPAEGTGVLGVLSVEVLVLGVLEPET
ncbi:unnamed protein product [Closterium sp. NIES-53]